MTTNTKIAALPTPDRDDRINGPAAFAALARRLDDITVTPYASATERSAAYAADMRSPLQGTVSYRRDQNAVEVWSGTAWQLVVPDTTPAGVKGLATVLGGVFPTSGSTYITQGNEQIMGDMTVAVACATNRIYRVQFFSNLDGGPGSSTTSGGGALRLRYTTSTSVTTSSSLLIEGRGLTITDTSAQAQTIWAQSIWTCSAAATYRFGVGLYAYNSGGVRTFGTRQLIVEDIGKL